MSDNLGPISINFSLPQQSKVNNFNTNSLTSNNNSILNVTDSQITRPPSLKTLTLTPHEREITNYLNIANNGLRLRPSKIILNENIPISKIILNQDHVSATVSAEEGDDVVHEIKHRVKKDIQRVRPVSEADLSHRLTEANFNQNQLKILKDKQNSDENLIKIGRNKSNHETLLLNELLQLSIKREKIEKALAATGFKNSMSAINWLMKHSKDPFLNQDPKIPVREYVLILTPVKKLGDQISKFVQSSITKCSNETIFNEPLSYMKLTSFFKVRDSDSLALHKAFDLLFKLNANSDNPDKIKPLINEINIDLHVSSQMVLLYPDIDSENAIKNLIYSFNKLFSKMVPSESEIMPYQKQLHLTLAYNFAPDNKRILEEYAKKYINLEVPSEWELRMYSRDIRAENKFTYKVIASYKSKAYGELSLKENEYIYASAITTKDNFVKGIALSNGESGFFPNKNLSRTNEAETWIQHKSNLCISKASSIRQEQELLYSQRSKSSIEKYQKQTSPQILPETSSEGLLSQKILANSENIFMHGRFISNPERSQQFPNQLRFFFARHGERIDLTFGANWLEEAFDKQGKYRRTNLNMPSMLPIRNSKRDFIGDSPLTEVGKFQARLTGEALGTESYRIHFCYASPAMRCIQTAQQILQAQGLENLVKIRIEPSLFEFLGWYERGMPKFLTNEALVEFGFNIDSSYKPLLSIDKLQTDENYTDYYQRSFNITKYLTSVHQNEGANILCVGHAGTLEVCTRQMSRMPIRSYSEFNQTIRKVPYLGLCLLKRDANSSVFEIQNSVIPPIGHTANFNFDSNNLTNIIVTKQTSIKSK